MPDRYRVLLVESDDYSLEILQKFIGKQFPQVEVECASPADTMQMLLDDRYHILVCDAFLRHEEKISFIADVCRQSDLILIVITGDSDIGPKSFSPHLTEDCIHHILYKPLDLNALRGTLQCAMQRVRAKKDPE